MPKTLKNKAPRTGTAQSEPDVRAEVSRLVVETRHLLTRTEMLAKVVGGILPDAGAMQRIPERGRVRVVGQVGAAEQLADREGVALAGGPDAEGKWTYTVLIDGLDETYVLKESALKFLGWTVPAATMYGEIEFCVRVDSTGEAPSAATQGRVCREHGQQG